MVWEWISPFGPDATYIYYRGYRYPYEYVPQLPKPDETPIPKLDIKKFRVPGAADCEVKNVVEVEGTWGYPDHVQSCVSAEDDDDAPPSMF